MQHPVPYPPRGRYCSPQPPCDQKPELVFIDRMEEKMDIFELTVPLETNIQHSKEKHFITDNNS